MAGFKFEHECGFKTDKANAYAMHAKHCDGKGSARSGRIAARTTALAVARPVSRPQVREQNRKRVHRTPPAAPPVAAIAAAATDKAMEIVIAGLMAKRATIDAAIAALEAVS